MKLMGTCRQVARKLLQAEDRRLPLNDRLQVRLHLLACAHCRRFERQVRLMQQASARWRQYSSE